LLERARQAGDAVSHLKHYGVNAALRRIGRRNDDAASTLMTEGQCMMAGLIVMGGYGHTPLRERLLGEVTYSLMHEAASARYGSLDAGDLYGDVL
jgi:nucleotide-binding universal stress UspA family protein